MLLQSYLENTAHTYYIYIWLEIFIKFFEYGFKIVTQSICQIDGMHYLFRLSAHAILQTCYLYLNVIGSQESFGHGGEEDAPFFLGKEISSNFSKDIWNADISVSNNDFKLKVDTGADVNILNHESF